VVASFFTLLLRFPSRVTVADDLPIPAVSVTARRRKREPAGV
jgi:hypothetical protein